MAEQEDCIRNGGSTERRSSSEISSISFQVEQFHHRISDMGTLTSTNEGKPHQEGFDESAFASIVDHFHSVVKCSPQAETCTELLKILDKLEDRIFVEVEAMNGKPKESACIAGEAGCDDTAKTPINRFCASSFGRPPFVGNTELIGSLSEPTQKSFAESCQKKHHRSCSTQEPPSPSSFDFYSPLRIQEEMFYSPLSNENLISGPAMDSRLPLKEDRQARRAVRKLETAFCSPGINNSVLSVSRRHSDNSAATNDLEKGSVLTTGKNSAAFKGKGSGSDGARKKGVSVVSSVARSPLGSKNSTPTRRNSSIYPDVSCKPFMLVSKPSFSDTPWKNAFCSNDKQKSLCKAPISDHSAFVSAKLDRLVKNGNVAYSLWIEESEELLLAKSVILNADDNEVSDLSFMIYSCKSKGRERRIWKQWGRKEKHALDVFGRLDISSTVTPEVDCNGKWVQTIVSDFVVLEARAKEGVSTPSVGSSKRLSFSSWDTTSSSSPRCASSSFDGRQFVPESPAPVRDHLNLNAPNRSQQRPSLEASLKKAGKSAFLKELWSDLMMSENESSSLAEVAAISTSIPTGRCSTKIPKGKKIPQISVPRKSNTTVSSQNGVSYENGPLRGENDKANVTVILPAGEHGCPAFGLSGPPPLLQRWRAGGKCDCGSWDLGCGLTVLSNQQPSSDSINICAQSKKERVALRLVSQEDGTYDVRFQSPLSSLQAFSTAIAIMQIGAHCGNLEGKTKMLDSKPKSRLPLRTIVASNWSSLGSLQEAFTGFPKIRKAYSLGCHPDPLSLIERV